MFQSFNLFPHLTVLDNVMLVYGSGISDGNRHNHDDLPILLAGRGGGSINPGRHVRYEGEALSNLYIAMLQGLGVDIDQFGDDDSCSTVILSSGTPAVEHSFRLEWDNGIIYCGHLDRLVEYGGHVYIQDQKTTQSTITSRYFDSYNPDSQMSGYTFAGKSIFNLPIKGVMIDAAQIAVGFTRFERGFSFRTEDQLNEWYDHSMYYIERARQATRDNHFPLNPSSCSQYGGCEFRHICSKAPSVREQFLKGDFVRGPRWDPLEPR